MGDGAPSSSPTSFFSSLFFGAGDGDGDGGGLSFLMRFAVAALVLMLTRYAGNTLAMSLSGGSNAASSGNRRGGAAAASLLGRTSPWRSAGGDGPLRRTPLRHRLSTTAYDGTPSVTSAEAGFSRSKSMAVSSARHSLVASGDAAEVTATQFRPLGDAPPIPKGTKPGPHYIFLVHGWLGNELEMSYLETALIDSVNGKELPTTMPTAEDGDNGSSSEEDGDDFVHVPSNKQEEGEEEEDDEDKPIRPNIVVYSPSCNNGRTTDGIAAGGTRLAEEIADFIGSDLRERRREQRENDGVATRSRWRKNQSKEQHVTISFVGNSLGGLYSRYALSLLPCELTFQSEDEHEVTEDFNVILHPNVFCTTATPHLGVASHTYLPVPRFAEKAIGRVLDVTGMDLFRADADDYPKPQPDKENIENDAQGDGGDGKDDSNSLLESSENDGEATASSQHTPTRDLIYRMCTEPAYIKPLGAFRKRIAYANAFGTDFQVPTNTASFICEKSTYPHRYCNDAEKEGLEFIASVLYTDPSDDSIESALADAPMSDAETDTLIMSWSLDSLGWTKVFIDTRGGIPMPTLPKPGFMRRLSNLDVRTELKTFIIERKYSSVGEDERSVLPVPASLQKRRDERAQEDNDEGASDNAQEEEIDERLSSVSITLESRELVKLMNPSERLHFPLGHTVMVANSKSEAYAKINAKGQPIMNKLAMELVSSISSHSS